MTVSFNGWKENAATFEAEDGLNPGDVVKVSGNGQVSACGAGEKFAGVVLSNRGGFAAVQLAGYAEVAYSGTAPTVGYQFLCADGNGGMKKADSEAVTAGRELLVVSVDTTGETAGILL